MAGRISDDVRRARIERTKQIIRETNTLVAQITRVREEFGCAASTGYDYIHQAEAELGGLIPLAPDQFDRLFVESLLDSATDPNVSVAERRRCFETLAKFLGRFRQVTLADAMATAPPPPNLTDPAVLAAALALDAAASPPAPDSA